MQTGGQWYSDTSPFSMKTAGLFEQTCLSFSVCQCQQWQPGSNPWPENTKGGSITIPLTSGLTGLESTVWQLTFFVFIWKADESKLVKHEVNGTVILPRLVWKQRVFLNSLVCHFQSASASSGSQAWILDQGTLKGEVSLYHWPPVLLVWNQLYGNWHFLFLFAKQMNPNQSNSRTTGLTLAMKYYIGFLLLFKQVSTDNSWQFIS